MRYRLCIAYDGTDYHGWQWQPDEVTVVGALHTSFTRVFGCPVSIVGASRTDAGVHALGQVAAATTDLDIDPVRMVRAWQGVLPRDITIRSLERALADYHPQRAVVRKRYTYHICRQRPLPMVSRYVLQYSKPLDMLRLQQALDVFVGTHDFRSFCTGDERGDDTVRHIESIRVRPAAYGVYAVDFVGPGFLRYMIRRIMGAALQLVTEDLYISTARAPEQLRDILAAKNPAQQLHTAPAHGLVLRSIQYL